VKYPEHVPGPLYSIPDEFKAWTMFNPGSYWLYLNEKTQEIDCTSVKHGPYYKEELCYNCPVVQYMWYYTKSSFLMKFDAVGGKDGNATLTLTTNKGEGLALTQRTINAPEDSDSTYYGCYTYRFIAKTDTFSLNGNQFNNVYHTRLEWTGCYAQTDHMTYDFFWARGIGLISLKKTYDNQDTTWSLVRWKAIQ